MHPQGTPAPGIDVRYTARDTTVFAFVRTDADATGLPEPVVLGEVAATPTTHVSTLDGRPVSFEATVNGLAVRLTIDPATAADEPRVLALRDVHAR